MSLGPAFSKSLRNVFGWLGRILKPPRKGPPTEWTCHVVKMKKCKTPQDLVREFGEPAHKIRTGDLEIWHYPLGFYDGFLYSIHAVSAGNDVNQVYMHMEPGS